jgi:hypothetical protein
VRFRHNILNLKWRNPNELVRKILLLTVVVWGWILVYKLEFGNFVRKSLKIEETNKNFFVSDAFIKLILNILTTLILLVLIIDYLS